MKKTLIKTSLVLISFYTLLLALSLFGIATSPYSLLISPVLFLAIYLLISE